MSFRGGRGKVDSEFDTQVREPLVSSITLILREYGSPRDVRNNFLFLGEIRLKQSSRASLDRKEWDRLHKGFGTCGKSERCHPLVDGVWSGHREAMACIVICVCVRVYVFVHQQSRHLLIPGGHLLKPLPYLLTQTVHGPALMWRVKEMSWVLWVQASQSDWHTHRRPLHQKEDVSLSWSKTIILSSGLVILGILWPNTYAFKWERSHRPVYYWSSCKLIKARLHSYITQLQKSNWQWSSGLLFKSSVFLMHLVTQAPMFLCTCKANTMKTRTCSLLKTLKMLQWVHRNNM